MARPSEPSAPLPLARPLLHDSVKVGSDACLAAMKTLGPVSEGLVSLLKLPARLYKSGTGFERISFSSASEMGADALAHYLTFYSRLNPIPELPDYALLITARGSGSHCFFVDRDRRVIVSAQVKSIASDSGSWETFHARLKAALAEAAKAKPEVEFVIHGERRIEV
jgi:hypothetical protein